MAVSAVRICNLALSIIGASSNLESLDENTAEAQQCKLWYDHAREQTLIAHNWNEARKRLALAAHSEDPPDGIWIFRYQYPSDCLVAREIENPLGKDADAVPFEVETDTAGDTKSILTDVEDAVLIYTRDLKTTTIFSSYLVQTIAQLVGHYISYSITAKTKIQDKTFASWQRMILLAPTFNANEGMAARPRNTDWIRERDA